MGELSQEADTSFGKWSFFKVSNSSYIEWLLEQSYGIPAYEFIHFCFVTENSFLEVVTTYEPAIVLVNNSLII